MFLSKIASYAANGTSRSPLSLSFSPFSFFRRWCQSESAKLIIELSRKPYMWTPTNSLFVQCENDRYGDSIALFFLLCHFFPISLDVVYLWLCIEVESDALSRSRSRELRFGAHRSESCVSLTAVTRRPLKGHWQSDNSGHSESEMDSENANELWILHRERTKENEISRSSRRFSLPVRRSSIGSVWFLFVPERAKRLKLLTKEKKRNEAIICVVGREERRPIAGFESVCVFF